MIQNGIDIIEIARLKKMKDISGFLNKFFTDNEISYVSKIKDNLASIAGILASKEALIKCLELQIFEVNFKEIEVNHKSNGAPYLVFYGKMKDLIPEKKTFSLSISHNGNYAVAIVTSYLNIA